MPCHLKPLALEDAAAPVVSECHQNINALVLNYNNFSDILLSGIQHTMHVSVQFLPND